MYANGQGGYTPDRRLLRVATARVRCFPPRRRLPDTNETRSPVAGEWICRNRVKTSALAKVVPEYRTEIGASRCRRHPSTLPDYEGWNADLFHGEAHDILWQVLLPRAVDRALTTWCWTERGTSWTK